MRRSGIVVVVDGVLAAVSDTGDVFGDIVGQELDGVEADVARFS